MMFRRRRRFFTKRKLIVFAVVAPILLIIAVAVGDPKHVARYAPPSSTPPVTGTVPVAPVTTVACGAGHDVQSAAQSAVAGLQALKQANLGPYIEGTDHAKQVDGLLAQYVTAEAAAQYREVVLKRYPSPFTAIVTTPGVWTQVAYTDASAVVRLSTTDVATAGDGTQHPGSALTDATLSWDGTRWLLALWPVNHDPSAAAELAAHGKPFCS